MAEMNRRLFIAALASPAIAIERKDAIWQTDAGRQALEIRRDLEDLGCYDRLAENWTEVEAALREGCTRFTHWTSRVEVKDGGTDAHGWTVKIPNKQWMRVLPLASESDIAKGYIVPWSQRAR